MCLRGIDTLTAAGLCAEIGDFGRFGHPAQVMSYLGVVPSEHSSGERRRRGAITKSGSQHARRLLVEAAWHYRRPPRVAGSLARRQTNGEPEIVALSWKAQRRLHHVWHGWSSATSAARSSPSPLPGSSPASAGRSRPPTDRGRSTRWSRRRPPGPSRQSIRDTPMGSRPPRPVTPDARRRALRRNPVLRYPTRAYQADRASRTRPDPPPPRPTKRPAPAGLSCCGLDKRRPYQV